MTDIKTKAEESGVNCCVDVGTLLDNSDCVAKLDMVVASEAEAKDRLSALTVKAKEIETDPCKVSSDIKQVDGEWHLDASFAFCCEAEKLIFELALR